MPEKSKKKVEKSKRISAPKVKQVNQREGRELDRDAKAVEKLEEEGKEEFERENP